MPARPSYFHRLNEGLEIFRGLERELIDRRTLQEALGVSKTVAWRILRQSGATDGPGNTLVCRRGELIAALERLQKTSRFEWEIRRRQKFAEALAIRQPKLLVEAPVEVLAQEFENLPAGVRLAPGSITIAFAEPREALEKLLALAMAISNDFAGFERQVRPGG
jgi:hypothetical protein